MFELSKCAATITNVNLRKENKGKSDGKTPAFDINFEMIVLAECIKGLYNEAFIKAMWNQDGKGLNVRGITGIKFENIFIEGVVEIKEGAGHETKYSDCKVKGFSVRPRDFQMVEISFQAQYHPSKEDELIPAYRCLKIKDGVTITVEAQDQDPTKNNKMVAKDDNQDDMFPNGTPEEEEGDPLAGSDLEGGGDDFEDFDEDLD